MINICYNNEQVDHEDETLEKVINNTTPLKIKVIKPPIKQIPKQTNMKSESNFIRTLKLLKTK